MDIMVQKKSYNSIIFVAQPEIQCATFSLLCDMESKLVVGRCVLYRRVALSCG